MTTITACVDRNLGAAWMAADRYVSGDFSFSCEPKIEEFHGALWGGAGDASGITSLFTAIESASPPKKDFFRWLRSTAREAIWSELVSMSKLWGDEPSDCALLVAHPSGLYYIDSSLSTLKIDHDYFAIGSGGQIALGHLHATEFLGMGCEQRLRSAIDAAVEWDTYTQDPVDVRLVVAGD